MGTTKAKKTYGRGANITRTKDLAKELRDAIKVTIETWASSTKETLLDQGYEPSIIENVLIKITNSAYDGLTWTTLHKGEGYNDPYHARILEELKVRCPGGTFIEKRVGYGHYIAPVFDPEDIAAAFDNELKPLFAPDE